MSPVLMCRFSPGTPTFSLQETLTGLFKQAMMTYECCYILWLRLQILRQVVVQLSQSRCTVRFFTFLLENLQICTSNFHNFV